MPVISSRRPRKVNPDSEWPDPRIGNNCVDTHILDRKGIPEDSEVDEIVALRDEHKLSIILPHSVMVEIEHPNTPMEVKRRAADFIFTKPVTLIDTERDLHRRVLDLVRGNAKAGKHESDSFHLVEAAKYARYFVTRDERLLRKRRHLSSLLPQLCIATPSEFLAAYHYHQRKRPR